VSTRSVQAVLRDAVEEDTAGVAALEHELFGADAWSPAVVAGALRGEGRATVVAEVDGVLAGYAVLSVVGEVADLERVAVLPAYRRSGLATALLDAVRARACGAQRLLLEVAEGNRGARAFYAAQGAVELDRRRRYYRDGSDALVLQLPLTEEEDRG
jgi:ribosomal-protein-alanine N-acetyltransferase